MKFALASLLADASVTPTSVGGSTGTWMLLVPAGRFTARDGRKFDSGTKRDMEAIVARTKAYHGSTDMVVDYDHQSVFGTKDGVGGTARAAGWIKELQVRDDGIWGRVEWTARAQAEIESKEYRYLSPVIPHRKTDGRVYFILNAALTNTPALENLEAAAASAVLATIPDEGTDMEEILLALGLPKGSGEDKVLSAINGLLSNSSAIAKAVGLDDATLNSKPAEILAAVNSAVTDRDQIAVAAGLKTGATTAEVVTAVKAALAATAPDPAKFVPIEGLTELRNEVATLRAGLTDDKAATAVSDAMKAGKVTPALEGWALSYAKKDLAGFQAYVGGAAVLTASQLTTPRRKAGDPAPLDDAQLAACKALGLSPEEYRKTLAAEETAKETL